MQNPAHQNYPPSYYHHSINPHTSYPALSGHLQTDTCVIGGGLSGLCTALPLAQEGHSVVVLEAAKIGFGASGRSGGQVISDFACGIQEIEAQLGENEAQWFWQQSLMAVELVQERIRRHHIQCDWTRGYATVAIRPQHLEALEKWQQRAKNVYGYTHYQLWNKAQLQNQLASERYIGAQFDPLSGHLHPLNYTLGIAQAADAAGAQLFENTPVIQFERNSEGYLVHTEQGSVACRQLVLAISTFAGLLPQAELKQLTSKAIALSTFIIATEPLGEQAHQLIANNMAICDNRHVLDYFRLSADGRLLFGGKDSEFISNPQKMIAAMRRDMLKVFPQLEHAKIDFAWGGECDITRNLAPHFGQLTPNCYFLQGYSGHGMAITSIGGLAVAEAILGAPERLAHFQKLRHHNIPGGPYLRKIASFLASQYYQLQDKR